MRRNLSNLNAGHVEALKRSKYRNVPTVVDGIRFQSKAEARRWTELRMLERVGEIKSGSVHRQPVYPLYVVCMTVGGMGPSTKIGEYRADSSRATRWLQ